MTDMARVKVTDPRSGAVIEVESDSPLVKSWGKPAAEKRPAPKKG